MRIVVYSYTGKSSASSAEQHATESKTANQVTPEADETPTISPPLKLEDRVYIKLPCEIGGPVLSEATEVTKAELESIELIKYYTEDYAGPKGTKEDDEKFQAALVKSSSKDYPAECTKLFNFGLNTNSKRLHLDKSVKSILYPNGILGKGHMGVVAAFIFPGQDQKSVAIKLERFDFEGAPHDKGLESWGIGELPSKELESKAILATRVARSSCPIVSPVKMLAKMDEYNRTGDNLNAQPFCYNPAVAEASDYRDGVKLTRYGNSKLHAYEIAYAFPLQSGDCYKLFKAVKKSTLDIQKRNKFVMEVFEDLTRQIFCMVRDGILVLDLKPDNYLYRKTESAKVRVMLTDWGLWKEIPPSDFEGSSTEKIVYKNVKDLLERIHKICTTVLFSTKVVETLNESKSFIEAAKKSEEAFQKTFEYASDDGISLAPQPRAVGPLAPAFKGPAPGYIAYFFMHVLDKYPTEVKVENKMLVFKKIIK